MGQLKSSTPSKNQKSANWIDKLRGKTREEKPVIKMKTNILINKIKVTESEKQEVKHDKNAFQALIDRFLKKPSKKTKDIKSKGPEHKKALERKIPDLTPQLEKITEQDESEAYSGKPKIITDDAKSEDTLKTATDLEDNEKLGYEEEDTYNLYDEVAEEVNTTGE